MTIIEIIIAVIIRINLDVRMLSINVREYYMMAMTVMVGGEKTEIISFWGYTEKKNSKNS